MAAQDSPGGSPAATTGGALDLARLREALEGDRPGLVAGPLRGELILGGHSNLTYRLDDGVHRWVLRRPPLGHVLATAHDMAREFRVMTALADTAVPVPRTVLLHQDPEALGAPFYLMAEVPGTVYRTAAQTEALGPEPARALSFALVDVLVALHAVDPDAAGLADFGRPDGFMRRQVVRWRKQLDASRSHEVPDLDRLHGRLAASVPHSPRGAIVHGDYRLDNTIVAPDGAIAGVVDWEMATLGDPLADLGLFVVYWDGAANLPGGGIGGITPAAGFASTGELVARYAAGSGRDVSALPWYTAFGYFKLAVIVEGIHFRYLRQQTVGAGFEHFGALAAPLAARGLAALGTP